MILKLFKLILIIPIRIYQYTLSPLLGYNKCRYQPTCSHYAIEAIEEWGPFKGTYLAVQRILRCHPWSDRPMEDPVPKRGETPHNH
jgi:putative membrane protein insertion efficiency factor